MKYRTSRTGLDGLGGTQQGLLLLFAIIFAYYYIFSSQEDPSWKTTTSTLALQWGEITLDAAMADLCHGCQASAQDKGRPATPAIKHSVILATLSAAALLTTHTE